jgi:hypothetical protein
VFSNPEPAHPCRVNEQNFVFPVRLTAKSNATLLMADVSFRVPLVCTSECAGPLSVSAGSEASATFLLRDLLVLVIGCGADAVAPVFAPFAAATAGRLRS